MRNGWQVKTLGEICDIARGGSPRPIQKFLTDRTDGINWIKIGDATASSKYIYKTEEKIIPEGAKRSRVVKPGDFLLSNSMSFGRPYIMRTTGCIHDGWLVLSDKSGFFDQDYLYYFLGSAAAYRQFDNLAAGSTVRNLNTELVKRVTLPLPPLPEQQRIVAILDEVFAGLATATANAEKNLKNAHELFLSALNAMFARTDWPRRPLQSLCHVFDDGDWIETKDQSADGIRLIQTGNIGEGYFKDRGEKARFISEATFKRLRCTEIFEGDCLISRLPDPVGRACLLPASEPRTITAVDCTIVRFNKEAVVSKFFVFYSQSRAYAAAIEKQTTGATRQRISRKNLGDVPFPVASLSEQRSVVDRLVDLESEVSRLKSAYESRLVQIEELKQSILQKAFSGKLTLPRIAAIEKQAIAVPGISPTDLHAGVIAIAYQRHQGHLKQNTFGHVKAEKIAHMVEARVGIDLGRNPVKDAAGPNDYPHLMKVEHRANMAGYFSVKRLADGPYAFSKKNKFGDIVRKSRQALGVYNQAVDAVIDMMLSMDTEQAEIFATVFAAWNNLLLDGRSVDDETIVREARENWHPDKLEIDRKRFFAALEWMKKNNIVPKGEGKRVIERTKG